MPRILQLCLVGSLSLLTCGSAGIAAETAAKADSVWGPIQYEDIQGTASSIDKVMSLVFDNFTIESGGSGAQPARKMFGASFPLRLGPGAQVTALKAEVRGAFVATGEARGTLMALVGGELKTLQFPAELPAGQLEPSADFILSLSSDERFADGTSIPVTLVLVAHGATDEDEFLFSIDSIDLAVSTD